MVLEAHIDSWIFRFGRNFACWNYIGLLVTDSNEKCQYDTDLNNKTHFDAKRFSRHYH